MNLENLDTTALELICMNYGVTCQYHNDSLLINNKFILNMQENTWSVVGKKKWYRFSNLEDFIKKYVIVDSFNPILNWALVYEIRNKYVPFQYTIKDLALEFGVAEMTIFTILQNKAWHDPNYKVINPYDEKYKDNRKKKYQNNGKKSAALKAFYYKEK